MSHGLDNEGGIPPHPRIHSGKIPERTFIDRPSHRRDLAFQNDFAVGQHRQVVGFGRDDPNRLAMKSSGDIHLAHSGRCLEGSTEHFKGMNANTNGNGQRFLTFEGCLVTSSQIGVGDQVHRCLLAAAVHQPIDSGIDYTLKETSVDTGR